MLTAPEQLALDDGCFFAVGADDPPRFAGRFRPKHLETGIAVVVVTDVGPAAECFIDIADRIRQPAISNPEMQGRPPWV